MILFMRKLLNKKYIYLIDIGLNKSSLFSWRSLFVFQGIFHFSYCQIYSTTLFLVSSHFSLNISKFCNDITYFIPDTFCIFLFFLTTLSVGLFILLIFNKNHWFFCIIINFCFLFYLFPLWLLLLPSAYFWFNLFIFFLFVKLAPESFIWDHSLLLYVHIGTWSP